MIDALRTIGLDIGVSDGGQTITVNNPATPTTSAAQHDPHSLFIANSGTTIRFLTAALSAAGGRYKLHGVPRMHERPIGDLVDAIAPIIDGKIEAESANGCPPVVIDSAGWQAGEIQVGGSVSSQYLSGLMMAAPIGSAPAHSGPAQSGPARTTRIAVTGELVSRPYVDMTAKVIESFGGKVTTVTSGLAADQSIAFDIASSGNTDGYGYRGLDYAIEPDASAASYFWAAAAISGGSVTVTGLTHAAMQGDVGFVDVLKRMGCKVDEDDNGITVTGRPLRGVDIDMNAISDTVQTLAVVALFADGPTRVRGVAHNRFKETDRIGDLACELKKLGATVTEHEDGLTITPPVDGTKGLTGAVLETYHDHRMAMSLSLAGLRIAGVKIKNPSCTAKTYPEYFADLEKLIGRSHHWSREA
ncbi:5-Enolpyruvylshikimate-3-phosphate synthase [Rhodopirellula maiorica SM1]|uniref:3-phosphoshikimate 1-carboxyvinyltransferase n=1 Tax=Rhodopirellula maiorica SM1 TaxID=1265738 RepID=M5RQT9_9BACT|nr:3-phosphoshikimate 1-carboxyvinyltransferase [Rhodopirellula maiorica]EMI21665.1 5-Enolpyruvylshikimate-3-phosphate synthase [Rhodopirellula maiorica SM1]